MSRRVGISKKQFKKIQRFVDSDGSIEFNSYRDLSKYCKRTNSSVRNVEIENDLVIAYLVEHTVVKKHSYSAAAYTALVLVLAFCGYGIAHAATNGGFATVSRTISGIIERVSDGDDIVSAISYAVSNGESTKKADETGSTVEWEVADVGRSSAADAGESAEDSAVSSSETASTTSETEPAVSSINVDEVQSDVGTYTGDYFELQGFSNLVIDSTFKTVTVYNEKENNCDLRIQFDVILADGVTVTVYSSVLEPDTSEEVDLYTPILKKMGDTTQGFGTVMITTHCYERGNVSTELNGLVQEVAINVYK